MTWSSSPTPGANSAAMSPMPRQLPRPVIGSVGLTSQCLALGAGTGRRDAGQFALRQADDGRKMQPAGLGRLDRGQVGDHRL